MKKLLLIPIFMLVFILSSCKIIDSWLGTRTNVVESTYYENWYDFDDYGTVDIYFLDREEVPYIDINDFLMLASQESVNDSMIVSSSSNSVSLSYDVTTDFDNLSFDFTYNYLTDIATVNHIEFFDYIDVYRYYDEYYHSYVLDYDQNLSSEVAMDFGLYGMDFVQKDGKNLVPFHIANLLFAPQWLQLYYTGSTIYKVYFDDFSNEYLDPFYYDLTMPQSLQSFTIDFMAFYFDYFYGLNIDHTPTYYQELLTTQKSEMMEDYNQLFFQNIDFFLKDFDDLHLWLYFEGYYGDSYDFDDSDYTYFGRSLEYSQSELSNQYYCENNYSGYVNYAEDILYLQVNGIDDYTPEMIAMDLYKYFDDEIIDVVFDLTCNPGGYLYSMTDMIAYFTDTSFTLREYNYKYLSERSVTFDPGFPKIDANLYVLISGQTYSAANVLSAIVQSAGLATVIGEPSSGGSSAIEYVYAPGGIVFSSPSYFHYTDSSYTYYEYGVTPDIVLEPTDEASIISLILSQR